MHLMRIMIRVTGEQPWNEIASFRLMVLIERFLKAQLEEGKINLRRFDDDRTITGIDLNVVDPTAPKDASKAAIEGYLREENPYPPGSPAHARWDRRWQRTDKVDFR